MNNNTSQNFHDYVIEKLNSRIKTNGSQIEGQIIKNLNQQQLNQSKLINYLDLTSSKKDITILNSLQMDVTLENNKMPNIRGDYSKFELKKYFSTQNDLKNKI